MSVFVIHSIKKDFSLVHSYTQQPMCSNIHGNIINRNFSQPNSILSFSFVLWAVGETKYTRENCQFNILILFVFQTGFHGFVQFSSNLICDPDRSEIQGDPPTSASKVLDIQACLGRMQPYKKKYQYWGYQLMDCLHCMLGTSALTPCIIWVWGHILVEGVEMWLLDFQDHPPLHWAFRLT